MIDDVIHSGPVKKPLLRVRGLKTHFSTRRGWLGKAVPVKAVDGVDLDVARGQTVGLVGESGSGKTTIGRTILRLIPAEAGEVNFDGEDVLAMSGRRMRFVRRRMQMIFQDPVSSLDPRMTVGGIVGEPLMVHTRLTGRQRRQRVGELLERVGLSASYISRYPHEFSGGQRQRIGIARALATEPDFIVCDEPVSALDVSIQAQILNLLADLQDELGLSYLFIAHNLAVVEHFADTVAVMYLGRIVEVASKQVILGSAVGERLEHPYTQALISSVPIADPTAERQHQRLPGEAPSPIHPPRGCAFHPRCPHTRQQAAQRSEAETMEITMRGKTVRVCRACVEQTPQLLPSGSDPSHKHACTLKQGANIE
jgi:oligopeptide/dipeptide ABC transporter ATP-binding protein